MRPKKIHRYLVAIAVAAMFGSSTGALAERAGTESFGVRLTVRESCEINTTDISTSDRNGMSSGSVFESCNTQEGFQVVAQHRWLETGERVAFNYAGQTSFLNADGWSPVATRLGAKFGRRFIGVRYTGLVQPLAIGLTITAF